MGLQALDLWGGALRRHCGASQRGPERCQAQVSGEGHQRPCHPEGGRHWAHSTEEDEDEDAEALEACHVSGSRRRAGGAWSRGSEPDAARPPMT